MSSIAGNVSSAAGTVCYWRRLCGGAHRLPDCTVLWAYPFSFYSFFISFVSFRLSWFLQATFPAAKRLFDSFADLRLFHLFLYCFWSEPFSSIRWLPLKSLALGLFRFTAVQFLPFGSELSGFSCFSFPTPNVFVFPVAHNVTNTPAHRVLLLWPCALAHRLSAGVVLWAILTL